MLDLSWYHIRVLSAAKSCNVSTSLFRDKRSQRRSRVFQFAPVLVNHVSRATRSKHHLIWPDPAENNSEKRHEKRRGKRWLTNGAIFKKWLNASASPLFLTYLGYCSTQFPLVSYQSNFSLSLSLRNKEFHISKKISSSFHRQTQDISFNDKNNRNCESKALCIE